MIEGADEAYDRDPEGISAAERINQHLPRDVRVLSVQRVNKKFTARRSCRDRTYEYYLPASEYVYAWARGFGLVLVLVLV